MKYCVINGSPKANRSRTMRIVRIFMDGIRNVDDHAQFDVINLANYNIMNCKGCSVCGHTKECKFTIRKLDDMQDILPRYFSADKIILATPLYFYSISSYMQKFLECRRGI